MARGPSRKDVEAAVEERIRPLLRADGGDVRIEKIGEDGRVHVTLVGRCAGCPGSRYTFEALLEPVLRAVPGVKRVVLVPWQLGPKP